MAGILFAGGLAVFGVASIALPAPGYMDAEFYLASAQRIVQGHGLTVPFVWNYLSEPAALPAPSHTYWQPLASLVAAAPMWTFGAGFRAAQAGLAALASLLPPLAAVLALRLGAQRREAWLAGALGLAPGFFLPYLVTTDTFSLYAVIGALVFLLSPGFLEKGGWRSALPGVLAGLAQLARVDGALLAIPIAYLTLSDRRWQTSRRLLLVLAGYLAVVGPWWLWNLQLHGSAAAGGSLRTLWLLSYDELFSYPASVLTAGRWWQAGLPALVGHRVAALWQNVQTIVAVNGSVALLPLTLIGAWSSRDHPITRAAGILVAALLALMTLVFPFAGARGGFFHSSAALMPLVWAWTAIGAGAVASWASRRLGWRPGAAWRLVVVVALLVGAGLAAWALAGKAGALGPSGSFGRNSIAYAAVGASLSGQDRSGVVAVNDPPGFYLATGHPAVAIPNGPLESLRAVVEDFGVDWVVLEFNHPQELDSVYRNPTPPVWLSPPIILTDPAGAAMYVFRVRR